MRRGDRIGCAARGTEFSWLRAGARVLFRQAYGGASCVYRSVQRASGATLEGSGIRRPSSRRLKSVTAPPCALSLRLPHRGREGRIRWPGPSLSPQTTLGSGWGLKVRLCLNATCSRHRFLWLKPSCDARRHPADWVRHTFTLGRRLTPRQAEDYSTSAAGENRLGAPPPPPERAVPL